MITSNMNLETGIHYGVIPKNDLFNCAEEFFENAEDISYKEAWEEIKDEINSLDLSDNAVSDMLKIAEQDFNDNWNSECSLMRYEKEGFIIEASNDDCDLFIIKSPYWTIAPFCSPCAPGACYLPQGDKKISLSSKGIKTYCLDKTWFSDEFPCPYDYLPIESQS